MAGRAKVQQGRVTKRQTAKQDSSEGRPAGCCHLLRQGPPGAHRGQRVASVTTQKGHWCVDSKCPRLSAPTRALRKGRLDRLLYLPASLLGHAGSLVGGAASRAAAAGEAAHLLHRRLLQACPGWGWAW